MKKFLIQAMLISSFASFTGIAPAEAQDQIYYLGKETPGMYVEIRVENLDKPGQPISVGQKFRVRGNCVVHVASLYGGIFKTDSGRPVTSQNDPLKWTANCRIWFSYRKGEAEVFPYEDETRETFDVNTPALVSFPFFDQVATADRSEIISVSGDGELFGGGFRKITNGRTSIEDVDATRGFRSMELFAPLEKQKGNPSTTILELDGDEESDEEPVLVVKRESSISYVISLLNHIPNHQVKIKASKQSSKSYTFSVKTDSDGDLIFRAKRNLKGYKLELLENGKSLVSKFVTK